MSIPPISKLSFEVLSAIFAVGHAAQDDIPGIERVLAGVCKDWLAIALRSPQLWTRIECPAGNGHQKIALYLRRSHSCPIYLLIEVDEEESHHLESLCQQLSSHFWRTRRLRVSAFDQTQLHSLLRHLHPIAAPFLHSISINCREYKQVSSSPLGIFTGGAPMLAEIRLSNISLERCPPPLANINAMYLREDLIRAPMVSSAEWLPGILATTSLTHLQVDGNTVVHDRWDGSNRVELPLLQSLCVIANNNTMGCNLGVLDFIVAPRLEVLILKDYQYSPDHTRTIGSDAFPSLHTAIFWDWQIEGAEGAFHVLLDDFRPGIQHFICGNISEENCTRLLSALSLYDDEDPSEHGDDDASGDGYSGQGSDSEDELSGEGTDSEDGTEPNRPAYLRILQTIAIIPSKQRPYSFPLAKLRRLLVRRKSVGRPIKTLHVSADFLEEVCGEFPVEEGLVRVEKWQPQLLPNGNLWPVND